MYDCHLLQCILLLNCPIWVVVQSVFDLFPIMKMPLCSLLFSSICLRCNMVVVGFLVSCSCSFLVEFKSFVSIDKLSVKLFVCSVKAVCSSDLVN